ncbi:MAG: hypothetical protein OXU31_02785 [Gammaproteobacteria bacterium]|nr:hypothetical protein [Gammaproteobacteria bacterium]MDD9800437.1 hypothetical protein [Gammaproteobacteria bacterium]MDD9814896.1 hypothetical protein [Gammaproteobacteria bacterium]MDD9850318.1 hypothetical protein [Gammaproteobacteria bacterium]MDD9870929.1 hypothetical protein [Gammaproteobacteria bacterium]
MSAMSTAAAIPERRPGRAALGGMARPRIQHKTWSAAAVADALARHPKMRLKSGALLEELDVVKLATEAHEKKGFKRGEQGTVVVIYTDQAGKPGGQFMVEFDHRKKRPDMEDPFCHFLDLGESEVELVWKSGMG